MLNTQDVVVVCEEGERKVADPFEVEHEKTC